MRQKQLTKGQITTSELALSNILRDSLPRHLLLVREAHRDVEC